MDAGSKLLVWRIQMNYFVKIFRIIYKQGKSQTPLLG